MIKKTISLLIALAMLLFYLAPIGSVQAAGESITTDKPIYEVGETVLVTGSGFTPWAGISLSIWKDGNLIAVVGGTIQANETGSFSTSFVVGSSWPYASYTLRAVPTLGNPAETTFTVAPYGKLTVDRTNYFRGMSGVLTGTEFPDNQAKSVAIVTPEGSLKAVLGQPVESSFSLPFTVGNDWAYGTYWGRAVYGTKTVTCAFEVVPVPPVPSGITALGGHNQVTLSWSAVDNPYQDYYEIWRATSVGGVYTLTATTASTTYIDTGAVGFDGSYSYKLKSVDIYGNKSAESDPVSATPWGDIHHLIFASISSPQVAGVSFPITVTAKDLYEHTVADYTNPAFLSDTTGTISPLIINLVNGVGTTNVTITKAQTGVIITATGSPSGQSNPFDVVHNPSAARVEIAPEDAIITADDTLEYTLTAYDAWENPWDVSDLATFTIDPAQGGTFAGNVLDAVKVGDYTVTGSWSGLSDSTGLTILPGAIFEIILTQENDSNVVGTPHSVTALALDADENPVPDAELVFVVTGAHELTDQEITNEDGLAVFTYTATFPTGVDEITAYALNPPAGLPVESNTLEKTWLPGPPAEIILTQAHDTNTVGEDHVLTATVKDQYGNFVADGTVVNFVVDREGKSGTANTTGGVATYSYTVTNMAGDNTDSIYATAGSITSNTLTKTWLPGPPAEFVWSTIPSPQVTGVPFEVTITAYDQYGNLSTIFNGKADLFIEHIGGVTPSETGNFTSGIWTGNITVMEPWEDVVLTAQSGAAIGQSNAFDVYLRITLNLTQGWNLVSLDIVTDPNPLTVFSGLPSGWRLYTWDPIHHMYLDKNHATLSVGEGFWLWVPGATSYTLTGPANLTSSEISTSQGWNLIGTPYYYPVAWDFVQVRKGAETVSLPEAVTRGWVRSYAYYWQGGAYHTLSIGGSFEPLVGYWFYAKVSGCTLIFPPKVY